MKSHSDRYRGGASKGRKPRPGSFEDRHVAWQKAVARMRQVIERLRLAPAPMGSEWRDRQVAYFERRLAELLEQEPKRGPVRKLPS